MACYGTNPHYLGSWLYLNIKSLRNLPKEQPSPESRNTFILRIMINEEKQVSLVDSWMHLLAESSTNQG